MHDNYFSPVFPMRSFKYKQLWQNTDLLIIDIVHIWTIALFLDITRTCGVFAESVINKLRTPLTLHPYTLPLASPKPRPISIPSITAQNTRSNSLTASEMHRCSVAVSQTWGTWHLWPSELLLFNLNFIWPTAFFLNVNICQLRLRSLSTLNLTAHISENLAVRRIPSGFNIGKWHKMYRTKKQEMLRCLRNK